MKNEADIVEATIRHQFEQGIDAMIVSDNDSTDGTSELLERLSLELPLYVGHDSLTRFEQSMKVTRLAAAAHHCGAGWIVPFDADEFWYGAYPKTLAQTLRGMADNVVIVQAAIHNAFPLETIGTSARLDSVDYRLSLRPHHLGKVAYRSHRSAVLRMGNHSVARGIPARRGLLIVHLPWRSEEQLNRKVIQGTAGIMLTAHPEGLAGHWRSMADASAERRSELWEGITQGQHLQILTWIPQGPYAVTCPFRHDSRWQGLVFAGPNLAVPDDILLGWAKPLAALEQLDVAEGEGPVG